MNPRQRRGVITLVIAAIGAIAVFLGVVAYVGSVNAEVGPRVTVYKAAADIDTYQTINPEEDVEKIEMPEKYVTSLMVTSLDQLAGQKARTDITKGSILQTDSLTPVSALEDGEREVTISFDAAAGINGRVQPGDVVDVVAAFARERDDEPGGQDYRRADIPYNVAGVLVSNAEVVAVGKAAPDIDVQGNQGAGEAAIEGVAEKVAVTFAVPVKDAARLSYGESFAVSMRLLRSGNNETGSKTKSRDKSFEDPDLPPALGSTRSK
ncbi:MULTISPECIES: Flp pilus assembly protein CpaB [unclassified Brevibacterium]|uniref:Flp pilus assembly protein CpaB n=1 Tax=unclassified Brevibacterium TaxID=2614124 RepID=UPI0008A1703A|nr:MULTISPECIES: Flp pilus assembly protein CpaB [unclassified Brevibacterium]OFL68798.1 Flp pilus assembly protein CpaB [Brevibacterium sp. HMSC063G07]OFS25563.1 Flp pilus assembly protein CpaB [Brevibacterium sp. HMSC07C04]